MTSNSHHLMTSATYLYSLRRNDPLLKPPPAAIMPATTNKKVASSTEAQPSFSSQRRRRTLSPVRELGNSITDDDRTVNNRRRIACYGSTLDLAQSNEERIMSLPPTVSMHQSAAAATAEDAISEPSFQFQVQSDEYKEEERTDMDVQTAASGFPEQPKRPQHDDEEHQQPLNLPWAAFPMEAQCKDILQRNKDILLQGLSLMTLGGSLTLINFSRRGLKSSDARLIQRAMIQNPHLSVLKLAYNDLGDAGAIIIASGFTEKGGRHHANLSVLDLGFNNIRDEGCTALARLAVSGNKTLSVLYLSGNNIEETGALSLAGAMMHGCFLKSLYLSANPLGQNGIQALARAVAENEACRNALNGTTTKMDSNNRRSMEELYLGDINMSSIGFIPIPSMLLTNLSLRILCLSKNGINDQNMALLSQALSRNKNVPLESVQLSFNEITCAGVECFMNAIWGSTTLREIKFDNNRIRDRGAQLAAVALTSIDLEVLDLGFNRVTNLGIKALMKSLSETTSLQSLSLSGIHLDATACKAVAYALAYCSSLRVFHVDNCQVGYFGQRHIVAGIVSNRQSSLRVLTGFDLGPIAVTLQMPQIIEKCANEKVLRFIRYMWKEWNTLPLEERRRLTRKPRQRETSSKNSVDKDEVDEKPDGPADPGTVAAAARRSLAMIGNDLDSSLHTEPYEREISATSPVVPANATMLERTQSGTIRVPPLVESHRELVEDMTVLDVDVEVPVAAKPKSPTTVARGPSNTSALDPIRKNQNLEWLRAHFRSLNEVSQLPFNSADLWQLNQYFFSPALALEDSRLNTDSSQTLESSSSDERHEEEASTNARTSNFRACGKPRRMPVQTPWSSPMPSDASLRANLGRTISFQMLGEAALSASNHTNLTNESLHKRRSAKSENEAESESASMGAEPATKRARNLRPRISFYPRIREKLEALGTKASQEQTLSLLRLLKFVESVMFQGKYPCSDTALIRDPEQPSPTDVEMIILDLL